MTPPESSPLRTQSDRPTQFLCESRYYFPLSVIVLQAFGVVTFLFHYAMPVSVFGFCYGRIFHNIRRKSKVAANHSTRRQDVPVATTSRDLNTGQVQQQATGATTGAKLSHTEMNVLKTMIAVIVCFMICWSAGDIVNFLHRMGVST